MVFGTSLLPLWPRATLTQFTPLFQSPAKCSHLHRLGVLAPSLVAAAPRRRGLGPNLRIPLLADRNMNVAREYGCLIEDKGVTFRASYWIDPEGVWRQITMNDLPVGKIGRAHV